MAGGHGVDSLLGGLTLFFNLPFLPSVFDVSCQAHRPRMHCHSRQLPPSNSFSSTRCLLEAILLQLLPAPSATTYRGCLCATRKASCCSVSTDSSFAPSGSTEEEFQRGRTQLFLQWRLDGGSVFTFEPTHTRTGERQLRK